MVLPLNPSALKQLEPPAGATSFPFIISETTGGLRQIVLNGRSLPFQGVAFPIEQRMNLKYFPGNPVGQVQVLGPTWGETQLEGRWADAWLDQPGNGVKLFNFPPIGKAGQPGTGVLGGKSFTSSKGQLGIAEAKRARTVRDAFYALATSGQLLKVEWGSILRYGILREFTPTHDREEDIEWEALFEWIGESDAPIVFEQDKGPNPAKLLAKIIAALQVFLQMVNEFLIKAYGTILAIQQKITQVAQLIVGLVNAMNDLVKLAFVPLDLFGTLKQQLTSIILAVSDLLSTLRSIPGAYRALFDGRPQDEVELEVEFTEAIAYNAKLLAQEAYEARLQLDDITQAEIRGVYTANVGETLRDIANKAYGNPAAWTKIADFNNLTSVIIPRGTTVLIPV